MMYPHFNQCPSKSETLKVCEPLKLLIEKQSIKSFVNLFIY